ncbi:hypothetical protein AOLI_G00157430 [Acnodon oligacanthus]
MKVLLIFCYELNFLMRRLEKEGDKKDLICVLCWKKCLKFVFLFFYPYISGFIFLHFSLVLLVVIVSVWKILNNSVLWYFSHFFLHLCQLMLQLWGCNFFSLCTRNIWFWNVRVIHYCFNHIKEHILTSLLIILCPIK